MSLMDLFKRRVREPDTPWLDIATLKFVRGREMKEESTWTLAEWAICVGADEFSMTEMEIVGRDQDPDVLAILHRLKPFYVDQAVRPTLTRPPGKSFRRVVPVWRLVPDSVAILREAFPFGLLSYTSGQSGWLEDPMFYRGAELLLGVISHETEAAVQASGPEYDQLRVRGVTLHEEGEWI